MRTRSYPHGKSDGIIFSIPNLLKVFIMKGYFFLHEQDVFKIHPTLTFFLILGMWPLCPLHEHFS